MRSLTRGTICTVRLFRTILSMNDTGFKHKLSFSKSIEHATIQELMTCRPRLDKTRCLTWHRSSTRTQNEDRISPHQVFNTHLRQLRIWSMIDKPYPVLMVRSSRYRCNSGPVEWNPLQKLLTSSQRRYSRRCLTRTYRSKWIGSKWTKMRTQTESRVWSLLFLTSQRPQQRIGAR